MKILFFINVVPPQYGGGYLRVFKIASRFKKDGSLFKIMTFTPISIFNDFMGVLKSDIIFLPNKMLSVLFIPFLLLKNRKKFDTFYVASTQWYTVIPTIICKLLGKKIILGITLSGVDSPAAIIKGFWKKLYYKFKNYQFRLMDYVFVNSPLLVDECIQCGIPKAKVQLINNPVDIEIFHPVSEIEKNKIKQDVGVNNFNTTFLFVGSINRRKGADLFPEIFAQYFAKVNKKINFIICGQDSYPESNDIIESLKKIFHENDSLFILKREIRDVAKFYQIADIFLFPTTNEGMPNVVLEAMATGCMIICNTLPGITDYVLPSQLLVHDNNVDEYINRIIDFENRREEYALFIRNNIRLIESKFSITEVDAQIKNIIMK